MTSDMLDMIEKMDDMKDKLKAAERVARRSMGRSTGHENRSGYMYVPCMRFRYGR